MTSLSPLRRGKLLKYCTERHKLSRCSLCGCCTKSMKVTLFDKCERQRGAFGHESALSVKFKEVCKLNRHYGSGDSIGWYYRRTYTGGIKNDLSHLLAVCTGMLSADGECDVFDVTDIDVNTQAPAIVSILVDDASTDSPVPCGMSSFLIKNMRYAEKMVGVSHSCECEIPAMAMRPFAFFSLSDSPLTEDTQRQLLRALLYGSGEAAFNPKLELADTRLKNNAMRRLHLFASLSIYKSARIRTFKLLADACDEIDSPLISDLQLIVVSFLIGDDSSFVSTFELSNLKFRLEFLQLVGGRQTDFVEWESLLNDWLQRIFDDVCLDYDCGDVEAASKLSNDAFVRHLRADGKRYAALLRLVVKCLRHTGNNPHVGHRSDGCFVTAVRYAIEAVICRDAYNAKQFCLLLNALLSKHEYYSEMALKCLEHIPKRVALAVEKDYARGGKTALMNAIEFKVSDAVFERIVELSKADLDVADTLGFSALDYTTTGSSRERRLASMGARSAATARRKQLQAAALKAADDLALKYEMQRLNARLARFKAPKGQRGK